MRPSTTSLILAFCAFMTVQSAPLDTNSAMAITNAHDFARDVTGKEIEKRGNHDFEYDADGNEIEKRVPGFPASVKVAKGANGIAAAAKTAKRGAAAAKRGEHDFEYDADGNEIEKRAAKKAKAAKAAKAAKGAKAAKPAKAKAVA